MKEDILDMIKSEIEHKCSELERLQIELCRIFELSADIITLKKTFKILSGEDFPSDDLPKENFFVKETIAQVVYFILREKGSFMGIKEIEQVAISKGYSISRANLNAAIYRAIKRSQLFKIISPGVFGLLEWESKM